MKAISFLTFIFSIHYFTGQAQTILRDAFGRNLSGHTITIVDWEGYMANPSIKLTVESSFFPGAVSISVNGARLYMNTFSSAGSSGPSKAITLNDAGQKEFYLSIFPDRGGGDEDYTLTLRSSLGTETFPVHVIDQDANKSVIDYNIAIDYSQDKPAYNFFADQTHRSIVRQAADDWAFFLQNMDFDTIKANTQQSYIWNDDFAGGMYIPNSTAFNGFLLYAYGFHCAPHRSGGEGQTYSFQTIKGVQTKLRPVGGYVAEVHGNYNTLGYGTYTDSTWFDATNFGDKQNDLYSIAIHEIGHAIGFNPAYPNFLAYKNKGYIDDPDVVAYQGTTVPVDASDHMSNGQSDDLLKVVDRISKKGVFGSEYASAMPYGRWLITKLNLLVLKAIGYNLKLTSAFKETTILNSSLPNGNAGQSYSAGVIADGGIPFYKFEVFAGALPAGLSLDSFNGQILGTATQTGTFTFTVRVTDYDNKYADRSFTINILSVLPAALVSFSSSAQDCNTLKLSWKIYEGQNNKGYDIEQSTDGNNFYKIGFVAGKSSSNTFQAYDFVKSGLNQGISYFRLKQMDDGNHYNYSPVITSQNICNTSSLVISPNPVSNWLHIKGLSNGQNTIKLVDVSGKVVAYWSKTIQTDFNISHVSKGIYFMLINGSGKFKIIKE
ncbi:MAG: putative Ig domain-containing protein [Williamsia sp.]|nr:putative Ig domain-containing protein [Williamsia sp.]